MNNGINTDSGMKTMLPESDYYSKVCDKTDGETMHNILAESRVFKNEEELEIMRWASIITCEAHCNVLRNVKPG